MSSLLVASPDRSVGALLGAVPVTFAAQAQDIEALVTEISLHRFGLAVLDDRLPGLEVTTAVRRLSMLGIGVLVLTGDSSELNHVLLRELGADDVVGRPYSSAELRARIQAILRRRTNTPAVVPPQRTGPVCVDAATRMVRVRDRNVHVAPLEYSVLLAL